MVPVFVGIAGGTGSGKTTVADRLVDALPPGRAALIRQDWYYRDRSHMEPEARTRINFDEPDAFDNAGLASDLAALKSGRTVECPQYDFSAHVTLPERKRVAPCSVVVVEGILVFATPELRDAFDLRLFVDTDDDVRLLRRMRRDLTERGRDLTSIEAQYLETVRPMHALHVAPTKKHAHLIIPEGGENTPALEVVAGRLLRLIGG